MIQRPAIASIDGQDVVLDRVDLAVAVDLDHLLGVAAVADPAEEVVEDAERAHPVAPDPPEHHRDGDDHQAPDQVAVDRVGRQRRGDGHQRRRFQEQRHRPPLEVAQVGDEQEEQEEPQEQGFVGAADLNHRSLAVHRRAAYSGRELIHPQSNRIPFRSSTNPGSTSSPESVAGRSQDLDGPAGPVDLDRHPRSGRSASRGGAPGPMYSCIFVRSLLLSSSDRDRSSIDEIGADAVRICLALASSGPSIARCASRRRRGADRSVREREAGPRSRKRLPVPSRLGPDHRVEP